MKKNDDADNIALVPVLHTPFEDEKRPDDKAILEPVRKRYEVCFSLSPPTPEILSTLVCLLLGISPASEV